jgi:hypothetical protein
VHARPCASIAAPNFVALRGEHSHFHRVTIINAHVYLCFVIGYVYLKSLAGVTYVGVTCTLSTVAETGEFVVALTPIHSLDTGEGL